MSIVGDDDREIITSFEFPYSTVTGIPICHSEWSEAK
jgi:hypothetical protein